MEKLSWYNEGYYFNHQKLEILCYPNYIIDKRKNVIKNHENIFFAV